MKIAPPPEAHLSASRACAVRGEEQQIQSLRFFKKVACSHLSPNLYMTKKTNLAGKKQKERVA
jgi:hypothetical protein